MSMLIDIILPIIVVVVLFIHHLNITDNLKDELTVMTSKYNSAQRANDELQNKLSDCKAEKILPRAIKCW